MKVDVKADSSPVTEADRQAEMAMKAVVQEQLPEHAVFGEEFGFAPGSGVGMPASCTAMSMPRSRSCFACKRCV
jgi:fructose-1,6-bisphosphatase/inositol monophosphatase family enzyme